MGKILILSVSCLLPYFCMEIKKRGLLVDRLQVFGDSDEENNLLFTVCLCGCPLHLKNHSHIGIRWDRFQKFIV